MLRVLLFLAGLSLIHCSSDRAPTSPAGKISSTQSNLPKPQNLRVSAITDTSAILSWDAVSQADDYDISYKYLPGGKWTILPHRGRATQATLNGLSPKTEYRWAVKADRGSTKSKWTIGPNFTTTSQDGDDLISEMDLIEAMGESTSNSNQTPDPDPNIDFNIDLRFTNTFRQKFSEEQIETIRYAASRWEEVLSDIPDWERRSSLLPGSYYCGQDTWGLSKSVDDLSIVFGELEGWGSTGATTGGGFNRGDWRTRAFGLTVEGCIRIKPEYEGEQLAMVVAHEIGHLLGFGNAFIFPPPRGFDGVLVKDPWEYHAVFIGPLALQAYRQGGGTGDIPLQGRYEGHWEYPVLRNTLMNPHGNNTVPFEITTLDLAAMGDIGYPIKIEKATPFVKLSGSGKRVAEKPSWCGICTINTEK